MSQPSRDLVKRTFLFAKRVRAFVNELPRHTANFEDIRQVVRASGSVAANYIEAQEGLSRRDFFFRIRVCRKEAREAALWLELLDLGPSQSVRDQQSQLVGEADELKRIFSAIASKDTGDADAAP